MLLGQKQLLLFLYCLFVVLQVTATTRVEVVLAVVTTSLVVCSDVPPGLGTARTTVGLADSETM